MTDETNEQCKEVYAHAGLAVYLAQCLEKSLENFLFLNARMTGIYLTLEQLNTCEKHLEAKTLGRLVAETRKHVQFKTGTEEILVTALERRNFLAHRFFKERAVDFMTKAGRDRMISELIDIQQCFQS